MLDLLKNLKIKNTLDKKDKIKPQIFFQILFDDSNAYLIIIDQKSKKEVTVDYKFYNGYIKQFLRAYEKIKEEKSFSIDWISNSNHIYLKDNDYLMEYLKNCDNLVNENFEPIIFNTEKIDLILNLEEKKEKIFSTILVVFEEKNMFFSDIYLISENYLLVKNEIYKINSLGNNIDKLPFFETNFDFEKLEEFLSLFYSYFDSITTEYKNYIIITGNTKQTKPTILFEEIDEENNLHIKVSESLENFEPDFLENYELNKSVSINSLENKIVINEVERHNYLDDVNEISKLLNKNKKNITERNNYYLEDNLFVIEDNLAKEFLHKDLTSLLEKFLILGAEKIKNYSIRTVMPKLKLSLNHGIDFFEGNAGLEIEDQFISLFDAINFYKKNSYIKLNDGTTAIVNKAYMDKLSRILKKSKDKVKLSFFDLPIIEELIDEKIYQTEFKKHRDIFLGFNTIHENKIKIPKIKTELRAYQEQGFKWLDYLHKHNLGGCLADDMGLGKTVQTIVLLSYFYPKEKQTSIIVMPKSLLYNWEKEIAKFNSKLSYYIYYSDNRDLEEGMKSNIIITTYAILRNDIEKFQQKEFYYAILDESQNIKNVNSHTSKAVMLLKAKNKLALSGTPIENNLTELYALFRFLNPPMFGSLDDFNNNYTLPIQKDNNKDAINELRKKIYPFVLRRLKRDVLKELPDKIEQILYVEMNQEQKNLYEQRRAFYHQNLKKQIKEDGINKSQFLILQALSELRQIASIPESKTDEKIISSKRELLLEYVNDVISTGHKVLIFTNYISAIEYISQDLEKEGIEHLVMTGATKDRQELVDKFQNSSKYKAFVMTLKTGGVGLNLTKADYVFIYDPWWNKSVENQAIDRTHRIGQDKTVFSYKIITKGTIEEKILELQKFKTDLFSKVIDSDDASIKSLSEDDLEFILGD